MARKSNLVPVSVKKFDPSKQLCRKNITVKFCSHHYASPHETELVRTELLNEMPNWHHPFETNVMSNWMDLICIFLKYLLIFSKLDMSNSVDVTYWCSYLFAFFLMARKSNLVPVSVKKFDPSKQLCRKNITVHRNYLVIKM
jgi:hypothetical protein